MKEIYVNSKWKYDEIIKHLKTLKEQYKELLSSFSLFEQKDRIKFIRETREKIYCLNFEEWRKDKLWEYMNDSETFEIILKLK